MRRPLLLPLVPLYSAGVTLRELRIRRGWEKVRRLRTPVISIGNVSTGGTGKTPLTILLAKLLRSRGLEVDVLSRGYGRRLAVPLRVDPSGSVEDFGDEPLLIARKAGVPVYVAPDRYDAGVLAESDAAAVPNDRRSRVHILDDGFQHRQLARDLDILLFNREDWQDSLLPAGNLREPLQSARRADVLALPANDSGLESELRARGWTAPIWRIHRRMQIPQIDGPVLAFCGLARAEQFFDGLEASGLRIADRIAFPDHHRYIPADISRLDASAQHARAVAMLTTEKDRVRMGKLTTRSPLRSVGLSIEIEDPISAIDWLVTRLGLQIAQAPL